MTNAVHFTLNPNDTNCRFWRTATTRLIDTQGPTPVVMMEGRITSKVEFGDSSYESTSSGPDPCPNGTLQGDTNDIEFSSVTPTYVRTRNGSIAALCGTFNFNGYIETEFSDEVFLSDIEAVALVLAAQANWGAIPPNTGDRLIEWHNELIRTVNANPPPTSLYFCVPTTPGILRGGGNASVVDGTAGGGTTRPGSSPAIFAQATIGPSQFTVGWVMKAYSWQSRVSPLSSWCRINGTIHRDAGHPGPPHGCNPVNPVTPQFGCTTVNKTQEPIGGTFIIAPGSAPMQFTNAGTTPALCA